MRLGQSIGHIVAFLTILVWGATFVSTKVLLGHFTPEEILFLRFFMGFIALCIVKPDKERIKKKSHWLYFIGAGFTGMILYYLCENIALSYGDASLVGVIVSSAPLFTGILGAIFLKEQLNPRFFVGFAVSMVGLVIISWSANMGGVQMLGIILSLLGAIAWGFYSIISRKIMILGYPPTVTTRYTFFCAIIMMLPIMFFSGFRIKAVFTMTPVILFNLMFLGLIASALCFVTWNFAVKKLGVVRSSVYIYFSPVITILLSAAILDENLTPKMIIGTFLVLLGLVVSEGIIGNGVQNDRK